MKVGDLVQIVYGGSRFAPNGTTGLIIGESPLSGPSSYLHRAFAVQCSNGHRQTFANFCLRTISESS